MSVDTPATIAILGAGPIGLEAGLYARYLGYSVDIYEAGAICQNVLAWGHVRMFSPFGMNRSPLGLAALAAQSEGYRPPDDGAFLTGREWVEGYLRPLAETDLLSESVHEKTRVVSVSRTSSLKTDLPSGERRAGSRFCILVKDPTGRERFRRADVVIDSTGVFGNPNWMGPGGNPAIGERRLRALIEYGVPNLETAVAWRYEQSHTLLVGSGYSAATNAVALAQHARQRPGTRLTWVTRRDDPAGPVPSIANDRLPERSALCSAASALVGRGDSGPSTPLQVDWLSGTWVVRVARGSDGRFRVRLGGKHAGRYSFDQIIANVGWRPDDRLYRELQVHVCYASEGPMKLAAALLQNPSPDCLDQQAGGARTLLNPEPNFYILGSKSYGRSSKFLIATGLMQIQQLFSLIGGRDGLDLYASVRNHPR